MKLISMTDFVLEYSVFGGTHDDLYDGVVMLNNYANFLKQPLKLEMFVCVDDEGNVLLGKPLSPATDEEWDRWKKEQPIYQQAKEKVLFEGCGLFDDWFIQLPNKMMIGSKDKIDMCVEDLLAYDKNLTLTQSALKQIGI